MIATRPLMRWATGRAGAVGELVAGELVRRVPAVLTTGPLVRVWVQWASAPWPVISSSRTAVASARERDVALEAVALDPALAAGLGG